MTTSNNNTTTQSVQEIRPQVPASLAKLHAQAEQACQSLIDFMNLGQVSESVIWDINGLLPEYGTWVTRPEEFLSQDGKTPVAGLMAEGFGEEIDREIYDDALFKASLQDGKMLFISNRETNVHYPVGIYRQASETIQVTTFYAEIAEVIANL